ncbi:MAG: hypothetical protein C4343_00120 [Chloroflexota bacterium]
MSGSETAIFIGVIVTLWIAQMVLGYRQAIKLSRRIAELRRRGTVAVGMGRGRFRRRTYAIVAVDRGDRIVEAEALRGWSSIATPKPIPELTGLSLHTADRHELMANRDPALQAALRQALSAIKESRAAQEHAKGGALVREDA